MERGADGPAAQDGSGAQSPITARMAVYAGMSANALRAECRRKKAVPASLTKASYVDALRVALLTEQVTEAANAGQGPNHKEKQQRRTVESVIRLLNVLFSDSFCKRFMDHGNPANRHQLDTRTTGSASDFWIDVTLAYNDQYAEEYNNLLHDDECFAGVDPASFQPFDAAKLLDVWKDVGTEYRDVYDNFKQSGKHLRFANFHGGRLHLYYLHLLATVTRPFLHGCIIKTLPKDIMIDNLDKSTTAISEPAVATPDKGTRRTECLIRHNHPSTAPIQP